MTAAVRATDLTKVFRLRARGTRAEQVAVESVSFEIESGRSLGIVGESGSGKTTLARIIVGLETQTKGVLEICGEQRDGSRRSSGYRRRWARRVQMVFQDPYTSLDRRQSGSECVEEVLSLHFDMTRRDRRLRVAELADQVGLTSAQFALRPRQLSGGQRQRLAIARALAVQPDVLVLDEAVSALDVSVQAQVLNCLADIREQLGMTYVFVSHDLGVIRQITDDVLVMRSGTIVERGLTETVLAAPSHAYTRLLKDSVPGPRWRPPAVGSAAGGPL